MAESKQLTFAYWGVRGRAQVSRFLLEYTGLSYTDKLYTSFEQWGNDKFSIGFDFPNLPYLIDGDFKLTESSAINYWIPIKAQKTELNGKNEYDQVQLHLLLGVLNDVWKGITDIAYGPKDGWDKFKSERISNLGQKLGFLAKYLGEKDWLLGYISTADFQLAYYLDIFSKLDKDSLKEWKNLTDLHARFYSLDSIKKYVESDRYPSLFFPPNASWSA